MFVVSIVMKLGSKIIPLMTLVQLSLEHISGTMNFLNALSIILQLWELLAQYNVEDNCERNKPICRYHY